MSFKRCSKAFFIGFGGHPINGTSFYHYCGALVVKKGVMPVEAIIFVLKLIVAVVDLIAKIIDYQDKKHK